MDKDLIKKVVLGLTLVLVVIGGGWLVKKNKKPSEEVSPEITLESSKMMENEDKLKMPMTELEKKEIEEAFLSEGVEMTALKDVKGGQAVGTAWRQAGKDKFYFKIEANKLASLDKGFYYQGWLVGDEGFFSVGRMGETEGQGKLYYTAQEDKSNFRGVVVTLESEDGNPAPGEHVLEGSF